MKISDDLRRVQIGHEAHWAYPKMHLASSSISITVRDIVDAEEDTRLEAISKWE